MRYNNRRLYRKRKLWFLAFTFAICCRPSVCLSVCLSVYNACAFYSGGWNFRRYFYGVR